MIGLRVGLAAVAHEVLGLHAVGGDVADDPHGGQRGAHERDVADVRWDPRFAGPHRTEQEREGPCHCRPSDSLDHGTDQIEREPLVLDQQPERQLGHVGVRPSEL